MEDLRQDLGRLTFFERRVLELRPDLLPDHDGFAEDPAWPEVRAGVARVLTWSPSTGDLLTAAARIDAER